jgi:hypothetical protein
VVQPKDGAIPPTNVNFLQKGHKVDGNVKKVLDNGGLKREKPNLKFLGRITDTSQTYL